MRKTRHTQRGVGVRRCCKHATWQQLSQCRAQRVAITRPAREFPLEWETTAGSRSTQRFALRQRSWTTARRPRIACCPRRRPNSARTVGRWSHRAERLSTGSVASSLRSFSWHPARLLARTGSATGFSEKALPRFTTSRDDDPEGADAVVDGGYSFDRRSEDSPMQLDRVRLLGRTAERSQVRRPGGAGAA